MNIYNHKLFEPFTFPKGITARNKVVMAPMTTWASNEDYTISDEEINHYTARVKGMGLVITGCTRVTPNGIGFNHEYAAYEDRFMPSLKRLATAAKSGGSPAILQIYHAGNKAIPELIPGGDVVSASAVEVTPTPFAERAITPRALTEQEISDIIKAFGDAARRAIDAGFDGVELHGAHGFLLQNFFSPFYNHRSDDWGGSPEKRMRFPLEVIKEVQRVITEHARRPFILGYRISPEEAESESYKIQDIYPFIDKLIEHKIDYLHVSLFNILASKPIGATEGKTIAELVLEHIKDRIPVIAAGQIRKPSDAVKALELGLSFVAIGQALVINPNWLELAKQGDLVNESLSMSRVNDLAIPPKLLTIIEAAKGWFQLTA